ncbi:MAG: hypothetical protein FJ280_29545 [Planctomycetes bacterium]|nr:hypothetical protein [Planctomycetota bacterium]
MSLFRSQMHPAIRDLFVTPPPQPGWRVHCPALVEMPAGDLLAAWYAGRWAPEIGPSQDPRGQIYAARFSLREGRWSQPQPFHTSAHPVMDPVLFLLPGGGLGALTTVVEDDQWTQPGGGRLYFCRSDDGESWSVPEKAVGAGASELAGMRVRNRPVVAGDRLILAASLEAGHFHTLAIYTSDDRGMTWRHRQDISAADGTYLREPAPLTLQDGEVLIYVRSAGPGERHSRDAYPPAVQGAIWESRSADLGVTWSAPRPTMLPNNDSGFDLIRLHDSRLALVYNHTRTPGCEHRHPLALALSANEAQTWSQPIILDPGPGEVSYPIATQDRDGYLHVLYSWQRQRIRHLAVDLAAC